MVNSCCVYKCYNRATKETKEKNISFHSFPSRLSDKERFHAWAKAVGRKSENGSLWRPADGGYIKVCSEHFEPSDFKENTVIKSLKSTAVPSIFPHQPKRKLPVFKRTQAKTRSKRRRKSPPLEEAEEEEEATSESKVGDHEDHQYSVPSSLDVQVSELKEKVASLEQSLNKSQSENKLLRERLKHKETKSNTQVTDSFYSVGLPPVTVYTMKPSRSQADLGHFWV